MVDHKAMNEGWEKRFARMREQVSVRTEITVYDDDIPTFSNDEWERLKPKIEMVKELAIKLIWGMVKGTIKYKSDDYTPEQWLDHLFDEQVDGMNYQMLYEDAVTKTFEFICDNCDTKFTSGDTGLAIDHGINMGHAIQQRRRP